jgi:hypothetical protein
VKRYSPSEWENTPSGKSNDTAYSQGEEGIERSATNYRGVVEKCQQVTPSALLVFRLHQEIEVVLNESSRNDMGHREEEGALQIRAAQLKEESS